MSEIWSDYISKGKHLYLNDVEHLIENKMNLIEFNDVFNIQDRSLALKNIKKVLKPLSYKKFLNKYRVYKSRTMADNIELSVSKQNYENIAAITKALGYKTKNETIELLCEYYAEDHGIHLKL